MRRENVEKTVEEFVLGLLTGTELEFVDVEYVREREWFLRVFLDKQGGLEIEDCQMISEELAKFLDEQDLIKERYYLEVSSPGLDRALKKERDFIRSKGCLVDIKTREEKTLLTGVLGDYTADTIDLTIDGQLRTLNRAAITSMRLHLDF